MCISDTSSSCNRIKQNVEGAVSGVYPIVVGHTTKFVLCDMSTDGGGWTVSGLILLAFGPELAYRLRVVQPTLMDVPIFLIYF